MSRESFGYSTLPDTYYQESVGLPLDILIADLEIPPQEKKRLVTTFRRNLVAEILAGNNILFDGVVSGLQNLSSSGD
jgi:hypothetical protein